MSLNKTYRKDILSKVKEKLGIQNVHAVPKIEKIVVNIGIGSYIQKKDKDYAVIVDRIAAITGQQPLVVKARIAVSNFKLRKNMPNGISVTLRGERMINFLDKLINVALPRTRDFRGVSTKAFDGNGNYSLGIREITIFPEVQIDDVSKIHGLQINIATTTRNDNEAKALLEEVGMPFKK